MHCGTFINVSKTDKEENKLLNKVIIFVFFAHKKYSRSFIKLRLNHWCHMEDLMGLEQQEVINDRISGWTIPSNNFKTYLDSLETYRSPLVGLAN